MDRASEIFAELGGEPGCLRLSESFYARVAKDPVLKPLFPGKSLRCATEELSAFLVQLFDGDESRMQYRWWLSLAESHARFKISEEQRAVWIGHMKEALRSNLTCTKAVAVLEDFFTQASHYVAERAKGQPEHPQMADLWERQLKLDELIQRLRSGRDDEAIAFAKEHESRRSVLVGILARMMEEGRPRLIEFVRHSLTQDPELVGHRFNGRTLLHFAAGSACLPVVLQILEIGIDPNVEDSGGHTALYRVAGSRKLEGPDIVRELVRAGAFVDHCGGVNRATALHQAARYGDLPIAEALLAAGANPKAKDKKGFTPKDRAQNCRRTALKELLTS
ncbi:MAG TPA: ankyrin repeat domain-containing protein [Fimbriimonas sp.]|nr:ankyrin repeat domain-containing protein [Fimbriimonas sp.]